MVLVKITQWRKEGNWPRAMQATGVISFHVLALLGLHVIKEITPAKCSQGCYLTSSHFTRDWCLEKWLDWGRSRDHMCHLTPISYRTSQLHTAITPSPLILSPSMTQSFCEALKTGTIKLSQYLQWKGNVSQENTMMVILVHTISGRIGRV